MPAFSQPPGLEDAYLEGYSRLRELCLEHRRDGLLVVVLDGADEPHGSVWLMAKETEANTAIVGRHTMSDLFLPVDPLLSLRHLAILVLPRPRSDESGVHFRILDLRSTVGFHNEDGHSLSAIDADGPVFIR